MENIFLEKLSNCYILNVNIQLTGGTETDDFVSAIETAENDKTNLIIDFTNCNYISSIVIGLLLKKHARFSELDLKLMVCGLNPTLENVLKMTKLYSILYVEKNRDTALAKLPN